MLQIEIAHRGQDYYGVNVKTKSGKFTAYNYREVSLQTGKAIQKTIDLLKLLADDSSNTQFNNK